MSLSGRTIAPVKELSAQTTIDGESNEAPPQLVPFLAVTQTPQQEKPRVIEGHLLDLNRLEHPTQTSEDRKRMTVLVPNQKKRPLLSTTSRSILDEVYTFINHSRRRRKV